MARLGWLNVRPIGPVQSPVRLPSALASSALVQW